MQTILSEKKSDVGSPYVYYTLEVETSNRTATQVDVQVTIKSHLQYNSSYLSNGTLEGFFEFQGGQNRSIVIKSLSDTFSGTTEYTVSNTFTLNASASQTSITCKFKVDGSRGSGTLYELNTSDITIPIGHNKPVISSYSITETNPLLISAGVSNNIFVANLSIKSFNIVYTLYDGATLYRGGIGNVMKKMYYNSTLPFSIDFRQNALYLDENNKVPIWVVIDDLYLGQYTRTAFTNAGTTPGGSIIYDAYDYINYIPISLIETNTTAKRDGQISGKVNLNISGTYFNGIVGNVDQTSYKPTIKYKFWRSDASEPGTYSYTVPSANITISNGTFSVIDYAIGSTNTSATNYFNPDYAYKVKIEVDDNFSTYYSVEKSIPVGEATWTEYPDHVDFKKLTIQQQEISAPFIIYDNTSGNNGNVILSDSCTNYSYLQIEFRTNDNVYNIMKFPTANNRLFTIEASHVQSNNVWINFAEYKMSGTSLTKQYSKITRIDNGSIAYLNDASNIYITKVIGYK